MNTALNCEFGVRAVSAEGLDALLPRLVDRLIEVVRGGSPLGFLPSVTRERIEDYWRSLRADIAAGSRWLFVAHAGELVVGSAQLALSRWTNSPHRAELQKLFVAADYRGRGVARALLATLHDSAQRDGRTLIVLNTRRGDPAESMYRRLGYRESGILPGWTLGATGERFDHVTMYLDMARQVPGARVVRSDPKCAMVPSRVPRASRRRSA